MKELMDKKELYLYLNGKIAMDTLGRLTRARTIPTIMLPGVKRYLYSKEAIDEWLSALQQRL